METIANCFLKGGFQVCSEGQPMEEPEDQPALSEVTNSDSYLHIDDKHHAMQTMTALKMKLLRPSKEIKLSYRMILRKMMNLVIQGLPMQLPGTLCNSCSATLLNRASVKNFTVLLISVLTRCFLSYDTKYIPWTKPSTCLYNDVNHVSNIIL